MDKGKEHDDVYKDGPAAASYQTLKWDLLIGTRKPQNKEEQELLDEMREMQSRGIIIDFPGDIA